MRWLLLVAILAGGRLAAQAAPAGRVILITFDGVRVQEFFGGVDSVVLAGGRRQHGMDHPERLRAEYPGATATERRRSVMPFFWDSLAPLGMVLGNPDRVSPVRVANQYRFSAPGYLEILTGQAQPDVTSNDPRRYPHRTVLEVVRQALGTPPTGAALFASWANFRYYGASRDGAVVVNAGFDTLPAAIATPEMRRLERLAHRARPLWDDARLDAFTGALALEYLRQQRPRLLYIAFDDTDDLAHQRQYDDVIHALHALDDFLRELWQTVQVLPEYRGTTTLILATDHGRGRTAADWSDHGERVAGAEDIWLALVGAGVAPRGEVTDAPLAFQAQIAPTILSLLGLSPGLLGPGVASPLDLR